MSKKSVNNSTYGSITLEPFYTNYTDGVVIDSTNYSGKLEFIGIRINLGSFAYFSLTHLISTTNGNAYSWISDGSIFINTYRHDTSWQSIGIHRIH